MTYAYDLENGQRLIVQNDGDETLVGLSSGGVRVFTRLSPFGRRLCGAMAQHARARRLREMPIG